MRIVILADPLDNQCAGIHYYTKELITHLAKIDVDGEYFIIRRKLDDLFPRERQIIVKNYRFPGYAALRMFFLIPCKLIRFHADVVVEPAHFGPFNLPRRIKRVTVIHDLTPILFPRLHRFHSQLLQRLFLKGILKRASRIITNSENTSKDTVSFLPEAKGKTTAIYLGRDKNIAYTNESYVPYPDSKGKKYFLFTGTIEPRKNLDMLLKAFAIFKGTSSFEHQLIIAGQTGWKSKAFFNDLDAHPFRKDILLPGYVKRKDMAAMYSGATAFIFPSLYEGFGLPVVEAMACGVPCLLANNSSLPEVGGDAALYFDHQNPEKLAELMEKMCNNIELRESLSVKAKEQAKKFSWDLHVKQFDDLIKRLNKE